METPSDKPGRLPNHRTYLVRLGYYNTSKAGETAVCRWLYSVWTPDEIEPAPQPLSDLKDRESEVRVYAVKLAQFAHGQGENALYRIEVAPAAP